MRGNSFTITTKPLSFYILATIVIFTILSIITISLRLAMVGATEDSGVATISSVDITQAGTGQSVTIDGTTMNEQDYGSNETRRTILNNNVVRYNTILDVQTPGTVTVSMTLPANNTIDEASVSPAAGCLTGSLSMQTVNGKQSYTNNKATCTLNPTVTGQTNWQVTAYLWGGNNTQIQPTISLSGQEQSQKPDPITVVGKANYSLRFSPTGYNPANKVGYNTNAAIDFSLYIPGSSDNALLGVEPINKYSVAIDMTNMPDNTEIYSCGGRLSADQGVTPGFGHSYADYKASCQFSSDGKRLTITVDNIVTAIRSYSTYSSGSNWHGLVYVENGVRFAAPTSSLTGYAQRYYLTIDNTAGTQLDGAEAEIGVVGTSNSQIIYSLSKAAGGSTNVWQTLTSRGWSDGYVQYGPVYVGESFGANPMVTTRVLEEAYAKNYYGCMAWNVDSYHLDRITEIPVSGLSVEYGVINESISSTGLASQCGQYGDSQSGASFFSSLDEARDYAKDAGASVNAIRFYINRLNNGTNIRMLTAKVLVSGDIGDSGDISVIGKTDNWLANQSILDARIVPGLLSHTITAKPSSTSPNTEDHITITPKTYNKDTNTKITVNLPSNLTPKDNSFYVSTYRLIKDLDYTTTKASNGGYTITFNTDQIATHSNLPITGEPAIMPGEPGNNTDLPIAKDNNGSGITRTPIEFDVLVDSNTPTPSTLTITSTTSGTGTNYASSTFKSASADIAIATRKEFGYSMSSNASSIYAGDNLSYTLTNTNTLDDPTTNLTTINVLPYSGDSRGTVGLNGYTVSNLSVDNSTATNPTLYYTTSLVARQLEKDDPLSLAGKSSNEANNTLASTIDWVECNLDNEGQCTNLPTTGGVDGTDSTITAIKYTADSLPSGANPAVRLTMADIQMANPNEAMGQTINNSITYTMADVLSNPVTNVSNTATTYLGSLLSLSLDKSTIETILDPDTVHIGNGDITNPDNLTNTLSLVARTTSGYNLTMQSATEETSLTMAGSTTTYTIPTIDTKPTLGSSGWSITFGNPNDSSNTNWHALPASTTTPLAISTTTIGGNNSLTLPVTYGVAVAPNTIAGTYTNRVVYTVTAGI